MSDNKYKLFRNYMVNELGITRDDIKEWTKQSVRETVEKEMRGVDIKKMANDMARYELKGVYNYDYQKKVVSEAIGDVVRRFVSVSVKVKEDQNE